MKDKLTQCVNKLPDYVMKIGIVMRQAVAALTMFHFSQTFLESIPDVIYTVDVDIVHNVILCNFILPLESLLKLRNLLHMPNRMSFIS